MSTQIGLPPPIQSDDDNIDDEKAEKLAKKSRNRSRAIDELISTEQTYVDNLRLLVELYCKPLKTNKLIKTKHYNTLFPEIDTIIHLNSNLLNSLQKNKSSNRIGQAMLEFIPFFKMYQNYVNNHENASKLLTDLLKSNNDFNLFFKNSQNNPQSKGQSLQSFLILPIQRVPRYELCLKEIIKLTESSDSDLNNLKLCYDKVCRVNKSINDRMHEFASREKVRSIERRFGVGNKVILVSPARTYLREGYLKKVSRKKDIVYLFILFSDLLIYCSETRKGSSKSLKLHQRLEFDLYFRVKKINNNRKYGNKCFEIYSSIKSFLCYCDDIGTRDDWLNNIQSCLDKMRANRKLNDSKKFDNNRVLDVAPIWIPDDFSDRCMIPSCMKKFTFTRRRHHCRYCGRLICSSCSKNQLPHYIRDKKKEILRVGSICYMKYKTYFPDFDLKFNRKNKSNYSISSTPKGADYEIDWDDDSDDDDDISSSINVNDKHKRIISASVPSYSSVNSTNVISPIPVSDIKQLRKSSNAKVNAYKPNIKVKHNTIIEDNNNNNNNNGRYQAMINTMKTKLDKQRKLNQELQGQIDDLRAENQRLRKSKVDLLTYSNTQISKYKKEISFLQDKFNKSKNTQEGS